LAWIGSHVFGVSSTVFVVTSGSPAGMVQVVLVNHRTLANPFRFTACPDSKRYLPPKSTTWVGMTGRHCRTAT
jgi:hypothetical protein